jgi:endogenous inhibitor of DNA gyrase (YacG/DUF329 family)
VSKKEDGKVKCPYCESEIDRLMNIQSGVSFYEMDEQGNYKDLNDFETDGDFNVWACPECRRTITYNEEDAIAFLKGKKIKLEED